MTIERLDKTWREVEDLVFDKVAPPSVEPPHEVVIVGGGPVGLTAAIDFAQRGIKTTILDDDNQVADGSRAICWSRRTLDIFNRIGVGDPVRAEGAQWYIGQILHKDREVFRQQLSPDTFTENPFFVNFQQSLMEYLLIERARQCPEIDLRWGNKVVGIGQADGKVTLEVEGPTGAYDITSTYVFAADGARSTIRQLMNLTFEGRFFDDKFLIVDIKMAQDLPAERRFWFEPPFHSGQSTLLHKQSDNVWRVDFQLSADADPEEEARHEKVIPRVKAFIGADKDFEIVWTSVYRFQCRRMAKFRHGNVFFVGDSAHLVSPFGARGGNGGIQDVDNLVWKMTAVIEGRANERLLDTYEEERIPATDENILWSSRATDFMTPKSKVSRMFRDSVLWLAQEHDFAKAMVNGGRMSVAFDYRESGISSLGEKGAAQMGPGDAPLDVPVKSDRGQTHLLRELGPDFTVLAIGVPQAELSEHPGKDHVRFLTTGTSAPGWHAIGDTEHLLEKRYAGSKNVYVVFRPDQHVLGVWPARAYDQALTAIDEVLDGTFDITPVGEAA